MNILKKLKGKNKLETAENYCILFIVIGSAILSLGMGLSIISAKGLTAILSMLGALTSFLSTVALIFVWVVKELTK